MAVPTIKTTFATGEVAPSLFGHVDLTKFNAGLSTCRNAYINFRGGAYSRAGTKYVSYSKQTGRAYPPRLIPFQFSIKQGLVLEFGHLYMRVIANGALVTEAPQNVSNTSLTKPATITSAGSYNTGDWIYVSGLVGTDGLNGGTYVVQALGSNRYALFDIFGNPIDATGFSKYQIQGTTARVYTLATPYAEADLKWLKIDQSADVTTICCVNQDTGTEYPPYDLIRKGSDTGFQLNPVSFNPSITRPIIYKATPTATPPTTDTFENSPTSYAYVMTAVSATDGTESIFSNIINVYDAVDMQATAGSVTIEGGPNGATTPAEYYNFYKAIPAYAGSRIPIGSLFGFIGSNYGPHFIDSNITPDLQQVPPQHKNPFARGQVIGFQVTNAGSGYTDTCSITVTSATGHDFIGETVVVNNQLAAIIIDEAGEGYVQGDTATISSDEGSGATVSMMVGPQSGTYPSVVAYFQQRRVFANTLNNPDTYWMSQPGSYGNFDSRIPTVPNDAITGTPWSQQVNGVQFMLGMPGGLVVFTGLGAWQLTGAGGSAVNPQPITPTSEQAQPQASYGCSPTVPPFKSGSEIIYLQSYGARYYDFSYNYFTNIYTGIDLSDYGTHLFDGFTIREHAWCEEPYKVLWSVRDDGALLSLTFHKEQQVQAWGRHDTNGVFLSVASVIEPPQNSPYFVVQRYPGGRSAYMIERMDNRTWGTVEDCWCVDCGLQLAQPMPQAYIAASSAKGAGRISGFANLQFGGNYSAGTTATVVDDNGKGPGAGAVVVPTVSEGFISTLGIQQPGAGYVYPRLVIDDPAGTGMGGSADLVLDNSATFTTDADVFNLASVGHVIRMGGGKAVITQYISPRSVVANIVSPIIDLLPNSGGQPKAQPPGSWTLTSPVTQLANLGHLAGATVTGVADGKVITPRQVSANGTLLLDAPATAVIVGYGYQVQIQTLYLEAGEPTLQGQRKKIAAVTARLESSLSVKIGANQVDGSTLNPPRLEVAWAMEPIDDADYSVPAFGQTTFPLYTADIRIPVEGGFDKHGQVAFQQDYPLPLQLLAVVEEILGGDTVQTKWPEKQRRQ